MRANNVAVTGDSGAPDGDHRQRRARSLRQAGRLADPRAAPCERAPLGLDLACTAPEHRLERLLDGLSYEAPDRDGDSVIVDSAFVDRQLGDLVKDQDLSRYIL